MNEPSLKTTVTIEKMTKMRKIVTIITAASAAAVIGVTAYFMLTKDTPDDFEYENNSIIGLMPGVDRAAFLAQMQENVDKSAIALSINSNPFIENARTGNAKLDILFENPAGNDKDLSIELFDASGESIYKSKAIREGNYLSQVSISGRYEPGEYTFTAYITAYDVQTHDVIGQAAVELLAKAQ